MKSLLVIDDDDTTLLLFDAFLSRAGYRVLCAGDAEEGKRLFHEHKPDAVVCDLRMPHGGGMAVLAEVKASAPYTPFVTMSGTNDIREATQALKLGAWEFLIKPFPSLEILPPILERLAERSELLQQKDQYQARLEADIADRIAELTRQLAEKDLLLAEVHHRVKNNLQVMLILLGLQQEAAPNPEVAAMLAESQNRLHTLALIQDEVHDAANTSSIGSASFFTNLLRHNLQVFGLERMLNLKLEIEDLPLAPGAAFTMGLVVNELLTSMARLCVDPEDSHWLTFRFQKEAGNYAMRLSSDLSVCAWQGDERTPARDLLDALIQQGDGRLERDKASQALTITFP